MLLDFLNAFRLFLLFFLSKVPLAILKKLFSKQQSSFQLGEVLADFSYRCGPVFIKFAQTMSMRADVIGRDLAAGLSKVQDDMPSFCNKKSVAIIKEALKDTLTSIDTIPCAAASIAQVHCAIIRDNQKVAVKILRPGIHKKCIRDVRFLRFIVKFLKILYSSHIIRLKLDEMVDGIMEAINVELDLSMEASAYDKVRSSFAGQKGIIIPKVYWQYTRSNLLVTQWIDGISIRNIEKLKNLGYNLHSIAIKIVLIFFKQAFEDGIFHADLHSGNILIDENQNVVLLDFGIIGFLREQDRLYVAQMIFAFIKRDYELLADLHFQSGYVNSTNNKVLFALACRSVGERVHQKDGSIISVGEVISRLFEIMDAFNINTQPQLFLLHKNIITVEGLCLSLYPESTLFALLETHLTKWGKENLGIKNKVKRVLDDRTNIVKEVLSMPQDMHLLAKNLEKIASSYDISKNKTSDNKPYIASIVVLSITIIVLLFSI